MPEEDFVLIELSRIEIVLPRGSVTAANGINRTK